MACHSLVSNWSHLATVLTDRTKRTKCSGVKAVDLFPSCETACGQLSVHNCAVSSSTQTESPPLAPGSSGRPSRVARRAPRSLFVTRGLSEHAKLLRPMPRHDSSPLQGPGAVVTRTENRRDIRSSLRTTQSSHERHCERQKGSCTRRKRRVLLRLMRYRSMETQMLVLQSRLTVQ